MHRHAASALALLTILAARPAAAVAPRGALAGVSPRAALEALPAARAKAPLRLTTDVTRAMPAARGLAWVNLAAAHGAWNATWDRATGVPSRIWGGSVAAPGASASPAIAEAAARAFIAQHLALLAPGSAMADLELASNHSDGRIRSVGFVQRHRGLRVLDGQLSVRFLADRLYVVSSQMLPDVAITVDPDDLPAGTDLVILPLVSDEAVLGYRVATAAVADDYRVYADPSSGAPLVRRDLRSWGSGTLVFDTPVRWPGGGRDDYPAVGAHVTIDGSAQISALGGALSWGDDQPAPVITSVFGDLIEIQNGDNPDADEAFQELTVSTGGVARWSEADAELADAQLTTYVHLQIAKDYARTIVSDPLAVAFLDAQILATVNIDDECNAFYSQQTKNVSFFVASSQCENTGRLPDVVYHEFGHGVHDNSIIDGVGLFDSAMSEGASDFFAGLITGDHEMGLGFFFDGDPLRDLDPEGRERVWPDDVGEVHQTGLIFGGAFWDLRTALMASLGDGPGLALTEQLFVAALQRSTDIPSSLIEVLAADDDDGDLGNGTPHECLIREAFGRHGLRTALATVDAPGTVTGTGGDTTAEVVVSVTGLSDACQGDEVDHVEVTYGPRFDGSTPAAGVVEATDLGSSFYAAAVPLPAAGEVAEYRVRVVFDDDTAMQFPDNPGDPDYELHRGELIELYCTDFETDPFEDGWTHGAQQGDDQWAWGAPQGLGGDPAVAYSGEGVIGMSLGGEGTYDREASSYVQSPVIELERYSDVRLQYRRWLGVEDGFFDVARILANQETAWANFDSGQSIDASTHTRDREWVFKDVPLSPHLFGTDVQVTFDLTSDQGLEFGGWTIDDFCIVADPDAICGDGTINGAESCDAGDDNADEPDQCRVNCRRPVCGDLIVDSTEACDDGNLIDGDTCDADCSPAGDDTGCCSTSSDPHGPIGALALLGLVMLGLRRRRS